MDSKVLNFQAKMITADPVDRERVFIISFYLSNDTISVFEHPQKNSGKNFPSSFATETLVGPEIQIDDPHGSDTCS